MSLTLLPLQRFERPLSMPEYYHAAIGSSRNSPEPQRQAVFVLDGDGPDFQPHAWQQALHMASAANPGSRIRLVGNSWCARWVNDAAPPCVRYIEHSAWDGRSSEGSAFAVSPLSLRTGPVVELILVNSSPAGRMLIMRAPHAVMDGGGGMHFLREVFRAMRGEPLLGTNAAFTDVELMRRLGPDRSTSRHHATRWLTGEPIGEARGDEWRRLRLDTHGRNILGRLAAIMAEYTYRHSDRPVSIAVTVDLRKHLPGLLSTANFSNILIVRLERGEGPDDFRRKLNATLEAKADAYFPTAVKPLKVVPMGLVDRLLSRHTRKHAMESALISNLGRIDSRAYSCDAFRMRSMIALPMAGSVFSVLASVDDRIELVLGMPKALSSNDRLDNFVAYLHRRLAEQDAADVAERG